MEHDHEPTALEEIQDDPRSRKQFLSMAGVGAGGALALLVAACGSDKKTASTAATSTAAAGKSAAGSSGDIAIVNYALTLEYLEATFYREVLDSGKVTDKKIGAVATLISKDEDEHVAALTALVKQLGGTPAAKPKTAFGPIIDGGAQKILETAASVENLGAAAYLGAAPLIKSKDVLAAALSIHTVEGRHAAALNTVVGKTIVPDGAFAKPASMKTVLAAVKPFIVA
jgi:rubrerythrin